MAEKQSVPDNLKPMYEQIKRMAPDELCDDEQFQKATLIYLKIGGVKLARQHLKVLTSEFCKGIEIVKQPSGENTVKKEDTDKQGEKDAADPEEKEDSPKE